MHLHYEIIAGAMSNVAISHAAFQKEFSWNGDNFNLIQSKLGKKYELQEPFYLLILQIEFL